VAAGDKVTVPVKVQRLWPDLKGQVQLTTLGSTTGGGGRRQREQQLMLSFNGGQPITFDVGKDNGEAVLDVKSTTPPGTYTVVLKATTTLSYGKDADARSRTTVTVTEVSAPITVTVLPKGGGK
jgi:hypothetical protein